MRWLRLTVVCNVEPSDALRAACRCRSPSRANVPAADQIAASLAHICIWVPCCRARAPTQA
eukprot:scaffold1200_cov383-Prasinococcus_capsulatus_cf.AAC.8